MKAYIESLIEQCLSTSYHSSDKNSLLATYFNRLKADENIKRVSQLDELVFTRMYGRPPKANELLKIRYWRCGYHLPANRQEIIRLGFALRLNLDEVNLLLTTVLTETRLYLLDIREFIYASLLASGQTFSYEQADHYASYYEMLFRNSSALADRAEISSENASLKERLLHVSQRCRTNGTVPDLLPVSAFVHPTWTTDAALWMENHFPDFSQAYVFQEELLLSLAYRYLVRLPKERLRLLNIQPGMQYGQLRHILYTDLSDCLWKEHTRLQQDYLAHTSSLDFSSEVNRYFKRGEKISRMALIRLVLLFLMPDVDVALINRVLFDFGFAPLSADITTASGVSPDRFLLGLLNFFETKRTGNYEKDRIRFQSMLASCDEILCKMLKETPSGPKGSIPYQKRMQFKDLRIMALHSLRKEHL